jgi:hypothetical protein
VPEHHREQPDDARDPGLVGELDPELGEVHLRLAAGRGLEPPLEDLAPRRPRRAQDIGEDAVAARVAQIADLAQQALARQLRKRRDALCQIILERLDEPRPRCARTVDRRFQPALEVLAHGLSIEPRLACDGRDRKPLPPQIMDHDDLPQLYHLPCLTLVPREISAPVPRPRDR